MRPVPHLLGSLGAILVGAYPAGSLWLSLFPASVGVGLLLVGVIFMYLAVNTTEAAEYRAESARLATAGEKPVSRSARQV
jgi:hypothetical protein